MLDDATATEPTAPPQTPTQPVDRAILDELIADSEMVCNVAIRLGRLSQAEFLAALGVAKQARDSGVGVYEATAALQRLLGAAVAALAPITFADLKSGWSPFEKKRTNVWAIAFGLICIFLILAVGYGTLIYNRAVAVHATLVELQSPKAPEQLVKLVGLILSNEGQLRKSIGSGATDTLTEAVYQSLYEIKRADERVQAFSWLSGRLVDHGTVLGHLMSYLGLLDNPRPTELTTEQIDKLKKLQAEVLQSNSPLSQYQLRAQQIEKSQFEPINAWFDNVTLFNQVAQIQRIHPQHALGLEVIVFQLGEAVNLLGLWVLPVLYGMLGSAVFHMRRYLDSSVTDPSWMRSLYRTFLGGFAGIVVVWIWTPTAAKSADPAFATLSAFTVAFLVGFSTDIFFQALDRLVLNISQWLSGAPRPATS